MWHSGGKSFLAAGKEKFTAPRRVFGGLFRDTEFVVSLRKERDVRATAISRPRRSRVMRVGV